MKITSLYQGKTRLIRLRAVDGYASDITRYSIDPSYNPHSYSPLVLQPTFDLWPWTDLAQNIITSSTPGGAPLYQVWWKSTQGRDANLQKPKTVLWEGKNSILTKKKYFVKNNEGEGANCITANLSFKKKVLLSLKKHIWGEKKYFCAQSAHHEREARSPFGQGLETHGF